MKTQRRPVFRPLSVATIATVYERLRDDGQSAKAAQTTLLQAARRSEGDCWPATSAIIGATIACVEQDHSLVDIADKNGRQIGITAMPDGRFCLNDPTDFPRASERARIFATPYDVHRYLRDGRCFRSPYGDEWPWHSQLDRPAFLANYADLPQTSIDEADRWHDQIDDLEKTNQKHLIPAVYAAILICLRPFLIEEPA